MEGYSTPFVDLDYCKFGFDYRKSTRFWTNIIVKPIECKYDCDSWTPHITEKGNRTKRHISSCDGGNKGRGNGTTKQERYRIPEGLINYLLDAIVD